MPPHPPIATTASRWLESFAGAVFVAVALVAAAHCGGSVAARSPGPADASVADALPATPDAVVDGADAMSCVGFGCPGDAGDEPVLLSACPATPPTPGSPCTGVGACEYGSSWFLTCNLEMACLQGVWQKVRPQWPQSCSLPDGGGACPATWAEANAIATSTGVCPAEDCQYPEGSCGCLACGAGQGQARPLIANGPWFCFAATSQCPSPRPDLGTPCDSDAHCDYGGTCCTGQDLWCTGGLWQGYAGQPCP